MNQSDQRSADRDPLGFLAGGGEMGGRTRAFDWGRTPLGPAGGWPQSLKTVVRVMLDSRYAMWLGWGPGFTFFYNDAYARMTLGPKHPWALGRSAREVWSEIWDDIGPRAESVVRTGEATWDEGLLLFLERRGFTEETYHTFSYSPVPDDRGGVGGMLCVVTEDTERTIGERRLRTLRELAARTTDVAQSAEDACQTAADILGANRLDLPFALLYLIDGDGSRARLAGRTGVDRDLPVSPESLDLGPRGGPWPFREVVETGRGVVVEGLPARFGPLPGGAWPESPDRAVVLPISRPGQSRLAGFVVAGVSPRRPLDDGYRGFLDLLAGQVATAVANARVYEEERRRSEKLAELDRAKTAFFSNVSHEFRTPLTLLLGPVEDLIAHPDRAEPEARELLGLAHRNALRLQKLVNSLLDFSRIEAGRVLASYEPTDLASLTADLASNFRSACERAGLGLRIDCPPLPEPVHVDRDMWEKVVLNLLSNAFKFTLEGRIEVELARVGGHVELAVRDTGTGIPAEEMPRLFERFHRIDKAAGRTQEGSGIGLALVRELARLHGGEVRAESEAGRGSVFTVSIPFGTGHLPGDRAASPRSDGPSALGAAPYVEEALRWLPGSPEPAPESAPSPVAPVEAGPTPPAGSRPLVLLADDNADMRDYVRRLMAERYEVAAVADGLSALASARARIPDLILSDVMMPGLDGFGLLRELRDDPRTREVPVLLLSARAGEEARVEGLEAGADDYITKPFHARELLARVGSQMDLARLRREAERERRRGDERTREILESITDAFFAVDGSWRFSYVNPQAERVLGREPGDLLGKVLWDEYPGLAGSEFERAYRRAAGERVAVSFTSYYPDHDRWYKVHCYPAPNGLSVYFRDATERIRAEERERRLRAEAAAADAKFRAFFEQGALFAGIMSVDGTLLETNRLALEGCGYSREQAVGLPFWEGPWWSPSAALVALVREGSERAASGETLRVEMPYFISDGSERVVDLIILPIEDESSRVVFLAPTGTDITDRKRAEEALLRLTAETEQQRRLYETALSNSPDFNYTFDLEGRFTFVNAALLNVLQKRLDEAVGRDFFELDYPPDLAARLHAQIRQVVDTKLPVRDETPFTSHLGERYYEYIFAPVIGRDGQVEAVAGSTRDITERKGLEDELRQLAADLSEADRRKDEFLATLAHELRNPLAPIRNGLQIMRMAEGDRRAVEESRDLMERQVTHMVRLIDDLMDISRIARNKLELRRERSDLASIVGIAVETSRPLVEASGHELSVTLPARPIFLDADVTRLSQVFSNLLNNAAKYTEPGGEIALTVARQGADAVVSVRDNGVGIPAEMLSTIFNMFTQVDRSLERSQGGLGIGLTLVRTLVEMHGGSIQARSDGQGRGSEFVVRLPVAIAPAPVRPVDDGPSDPAATRRILVVDDNKDSARTLAKLLKILRHEARTAHDGGEAVSAAEQYRPEVILLDIGMPVMNGYDVARAIRSRPWGRDVVIIALTGWGQEGDRRRSKEAGIDHHLVKPVDPAALERFLADLPHADEAAP